MMQVVTNNDKTYRQLILQVLRRRDDKIDAL